MDRTQSGLFDALGAAGDVFTSQATSDTPDLATGHGIDKSRLGKPKRRSSTKGLPMVAKQLFKKPRYSANEKWLEDEPDYKESKEYKEALEAVRQRVLNVLIVSYAGLGRMLNDLNPKYPAFLDSILDDLQGVIKYEKHRPAPVLVMSVNADKEDVDYVEVFRRAA